MHMYKYIRLIVKYAFIIYTFCLYYMLSLVRSWSIKVTNFSKQWHTLNANCTDKGHKPSEANELQLFLKAVEQVAIWISLAEALMAS